MIDPDIKLLEWKPPDCILEIYEGEKKIVETETSRFSDHALDTIVWAHRIQGRRIVWRLED